MDERLRGLADALEGLGAFEALPCAGERHQVVGAQACLHLRCTVPSPRREEVLGQVASVARRAQFVLAALVDVRDQYSLGWIPGQRGGDVVDAAAKLAGLLTDSAQLSSDQVPDRRGRF